MGQPFLLAARRQRRGQLNGLGQRVAAGFGVAHYVGRHAQPVAQLGLRQAQVRPHGGGFAGRGQGRAWQPARPAPAPGAAGA